MLETITILYIYTSSQVISKCNIHLNTEYVDPVPSYVCNVDIQRQSGTSRTSRLNEHHP